jgi:gelsolin
MAKKYADIIFLFLQELLHEGNRPKSHIIRVMEAFETVMFRSKFDKWPKKADAVVSDESRGKVAG